MPTKECCRILVTPLLIVLHAVLLLLLFASFHSLFFHLKDLGSWLDTGAKCCLPQPLLPELLIMFLSGKFLVALVLLLGILPMGTITISQLLRGRFSILRSKKPGQWLLDVVLNFKCHLMDFINAKESNCSHFPFLLRGKG